MFTDISFEVRKGEIVGLGGLVGAGRTDVARAIFGVAPARQRHASPINGKAVDDRRAVAGHRARPRLRARGPRRRRHLPHAVGRGEHHRRRAAARSRRAASSAARSRRRWPRTRSSKLRIRLASLRQPIGELSGGNQQKAILARWLLTDPSVLILDEPTRGIDIGVKAEFYDMIGELAAGGRAILLISSELPELLALCDRVLVMSEGRLTANIPRAEATQEAIMQRRRAAQRAGVAA